MRSYFQIDKSFRRGIKMCFRPTRPGVINRSRINILKTRKLYSQCLRKRCFPRFSGPGKILQLTLWNLASWWQPWQVRPSKIGFFHGMHRQERGQSRSLRGRCAAPIALEFGPCDNFNAGKWNRNAATLAWLLRLVTVPFETSITSFGN
jgi:hypothetical protein